MFGLQQELGEPLKGPNMARGGWIAYLKIYKALEQILVQQKA